MDITLPRVGTNMEEATITRWIRSIGERFSRGDPLYEIETDKVTFEVEASAEGILVEIRVQPGEIAAVGQIVAVASE